MALHGVLYLWLRGHRHATLPHGAACKYLLHIHFTPTKVKLALGMTQAKQIESNYIIAVYYNQKQNKQNASPLQRVLAGSEGVEGTRSLSRPILNHQFCKQVCKP